MIDKKTIQKIVRDVLRHHQGLKDHQIMHPLREWFSGLGIAVLALAACLFWCIHLYWEYSTLAPQHDNNSDTTQVVYRENQVHEALQELSERQKLHEEIKNRLAANVNVTPEAVPVETPETIETPVTETTPTTTPELNEDPIPPPEATSEENVESEPPTLGN